MTRRAGLLAVLLTALAACSRDAGVGRAELDAALERAAAEGKLVLLDFYGDHCPPCARMKKETWPAAEVREQLERYVFLDVDTSVSPGLVQEFGVRAIPTVTILDATGRVRESQMGFRSAAQMAEILRRHADGQ